MADVEQYIFDEKDKLLEWNSSGFGGGLNVQRLFTYDNNERLTEYYEIDFYHSLVTKMNVSYVKDTIQLEQVTISRGDTTSAWLEKYDRRGEVITYNDPAVIEEFDERGNLVSAFHKGLGSLYSSFTLTYDYDSKNNKVKETKYDSINNVVETTLFYYNDKNNLVEEVEVDSIGTEIKRFNELGNVVDYSSTPFEEEVPYYGFWRNCDQYGNVIKWVFLNRDENGKLVEQMTSIDLEYDKLGNWISKKVFENDSLVAMSKRVISYY